MNKELKPVRCGCGGEANIHKDDGTFGQMPIYTVSCNTCGMRSGRRSTEVQAVTAWNRAMGTNDINVPNKERTYKVTDIHVDEYYCPACGAEIPHSHEDKGDNYCRECGAKLDWGKYE